MTGRDPRDTIDHAPMSGFQILAVALLGLDGFDVLSISFAAPGIAADMLAGYLFKTGHGLPGVATIPASESLLAACSLIVAFRRQPATTNVDR